MDPLVVEKVKKWLELGRIDPSKAVIKHHPDDEAKFKLVRQKVKTLSDQSRSSKREKMLSSIDKLRAMRSVVNESDEELRNAERLKRTGGLPGWKNNNRTKERYGMQEPELSPHKKFSKMVDSLKKANSALTLKKRSSLFNKGVAHAKSANMNLNSLSANKALSSSNRIDTLLNPDSTNSDELSDADKHKLIRRTLLAAIRKDRWAHAPNFSMPLLDKTIRSKQKIWNLRNKLKYGSQ